MRVLLLCTPLLLAAVLGGCDGRANVLITGRLTDYGPRDSVWVSLTDNWEYVKMAPTRFNIQSSGAFELEFTVGKVPPPVTIVKNGEVYAKLKIHNLWDHSPVIIDEVRGKIFDITIKENSLFTARVEL